MAAAAEIHGRDPQDDRLVPLHAVAEAYGIKRATVWKWVEKKLIPAPVVNRHRYTRWSNNQIQADIAAMKRKEVQEAAA